MKTAVLQTRVDKDLKQDADAFFESIGMDTTTAIRIFLKQTFVTTSEKKQKKRRIHHETQLHTM